MKAKRSLAQHFLVSSKAVEGILSACREGARSAGGILEIGPGQGALTGGLAALGLPLVLIEKDDAFSAALAAEFSGAKIIHSDAREIDLSSLAIEAGITKWMVAGNLPYNVGTEIARCVLAAPSRCSAVVFMLQREVVAKLAAAPGEEGYGPLAAWTASSWTARRLFEVPPGAFRPAPKVTSEVVSLLPRSAALVAEEDLGAFWRYLRTAFARPRRTLVANLEVAASGSREWVTALLEREGLLRDVRPASVPPSVYAALFHFTPK